MDNQIRESLSFTNYSSCLKYCKNIEISNNSIPTKKGANFNIPIKID